MIRNASDELAVSRGYWFDEERADHVVEWIEDYCRLYEGDHAGERLVLSDWQLDATRRLFGWVHHSRDWGRIVRRFRRASIWLPKKNKKSPTLAAWGVYLFAGDGEKGQKVYSAARDGGQAMISHRHALEMIRQSDELAAECHIHNQTGQITHLPTSSIYKILAGDNAKSQEGLNGSVLIDETHVVDAKLARIIRRAGISRSEPIQIEVSTAGNDPDSYGKEQYDLGKEIESGVRPLLDTFFVAYEAPAGTTFESLEKRKELVRVGRLANPAWNHTVKESEFVADYEASKARATARLDFLMYRLNIWQFSSNPWLSPHAWEACRREFTLDNLRGRECFGGLDLASVKDSNALALCFPDVAAGTFDFLWWYWLPRERAEALQNQTPWLQWEKDPRCNVTLTPGSAVYPEAVRKKVRELAGMFEIVELAFDPNGAEQCTREICEGIMLPDGKIIEPETEIERFAHGQGIQTFNEPTKKFEELVLSGKLRHNGDPVTTWQAGHAAVRRDVNDNCKPVKPDGKNGVKVIDGMIAAIMALSRAIAAQGEGSIYDDPNEGEVVF